MCFIKGALTAFAPNVYVFTLLRLIAGFAGAGVQGQVS